MVGLLGCCCCCCLLLLWAFVVTFSDFVGVDVVIGRCCCSWFYQIFCLVVTGVFNFYFGCYVFGDAMVWVSFSKCLQN